MKTLKPQQAFLGLEEEDAVSYDEAKAVIIPFGLEASVSYGGGTNKGPQAMIDASHEVELFDEHFWCEPFREIGIVTLEEPKISKEIPEALEQLENLVQTALDDNKFPFVFGGEHSITAGAIRPYAEKYQDLVILHFDAHADLRDGYEGEHYSHASALRRCLDDHRVKNNGSKLQLVSCGIRNISAGEIPFLEENLDRIHIYWAKDKKNWEIEEIISHVKDKPIYLTFDVDGFDASIMPATGTPEPGGMFWDEVIEIIKKASKAGNIIGADINELAPIEGWHACDFLAAKLAYKILSIAFLEDK
ncbi:agmatinase [Rickettsiales bacterium]|nr:agmatinase [Rickettsiales bacterium]